MAEPRPPRQGSYGFVVTGIDLPVDAWDALGGMFADLEATGCDCIWLSDHLFSGHPSAEPLVLAAVAAASTSTCAIGTGVLQLPLRRSAAVAKAAATLQLVSGGRFRLGVGVGQHVREFERAGVAYDRRGTATDRMLREVVEYWQASDDWFSMHPPVSVPIWVGGTSGAAMDRVVGFGAGWLSLFQTAERYAGANHALSTALAAHDRRPEEVERRIVLLVGPTSPKWSRSDALEWASRQFPAGIRGIDRHIITGTIDECVDAVRRFEVAGAHGIDLQITHPDPVPHFGALRQALVAGENPTP